MILLRFSCRSCWVRMPKIFFIRLSAKELRKLLIRWRRRENVRILRTFFAWEHARARVHTCGVHAQKKERVVLTLFLFEVSERAAGNDHVTFLTFLFPSRACLFNSLHWLRSLNRSAVTYCVTCMTWNNKIYSLLQFCSVSGIGARELWGILRSDSQSKLETQDDMIPVDVKVIQFFSQSVTKFTLRRLLSSLCLLVLIYSDVCSVV